MAYHPIGTQPWPEAMLTKILSINPLGTNQGNLKQNITISFKEMHLKMLPIICRHFQMNFFHRTFFFVVVFFIKISLKYGLIGPRSPKDNKFKLDNGLAPKS